MKNLLLLFMLFCLLSCKEKKQSDIDQMTKTIKKGIEDRSFKENATMNLIEFKYLRCDTLDDNVLKNNRLDDYIAEWQSHIKALKENNQAMATSLNKMRTYSSLGWGDLLDGEKINSSKLIDNGKSIKDSITKYDKLVTDLQANIKGNKTPKVIYQMVFFLKAVYKKGDLSKNYLDTNYYLFNKNLTVVK